MAGDDDLRINASLEGDLADALRKIEQRIDGLERKLDDLGNTGRAAGDQVAAGTDKASDGLDKADKSARRAATGFEAAARNAREAGKAGEAAGKGAKDAADGLGEAGRSAKAATGGLDDFASGARKTAAAAMETARAASSAARKLDEAGDEATEAGLKAAASASGWNKLWRAIDSQERITRRYVAASAAMRSEWDKSSAAVDRMVGRLSRGRAAMASFLDMDYDGASKKLGRLSKTFGGFGKVLSAFKIGAVVTAIWALLGAISALGAGAVGAVGGIGALVPAFAAVVGAAAYVKVAMMGIKGAMEYVQDSADNVSSKFKVFGESIAKGGLGKGLDYFANNIGVVSKGLQEAGDEIGGFSRRLLVLSADYTKTISFMGRFKIITETMVTVVEQLGGAAYSLGKTLIAVFAAAGPATSQFATDVNNLAMALFRQTNEAYESGRLSAMISKSYEALSRAAGILASFLVGLFRIFRIGAQESAWMADSLDEASLKFAGWTASLQGQEAIRNYFRDAQPAIRETGLLIRDIFVGLGKMATHANIAPLLNQVRVELLPALFDLLHVVNGNLAPGLVELATNLATLFAGLDFSGLALFIGALNEFLNAIIWAQQNIPGFNLLLSTMMSLLFLLGPGFKIASYGVLIFGRFMTVFGAIAGNLRVFVSLMAMSSGWIGVLGRGILAVTGFLTGALKFAITAITTALRLLFVATPIGWIILAITALVAAFIWAYNNVAWFRDGVNAVLSAVGGFFVSLWQDYVWPSLKAIGDFFVGVWNGAVAAFQWLGSTIAEIWTGYIQPVLEGIWYVLKIIGAVIFTIFVAPFVLAFNLISEMVMTCYYSYVKPVLDMLGVAFGWVFDTLIKPAIDLFVLTWNNMGLIMEIMYNTYVKPVLDAVGAIFTWIFVNVIQPVIDFFTMMFGLAMLGIQVVYNSVIKPTLDAIGAIFTWIFVNVIQPIIDFFTWYWDVSMLAMQLAYQQYIVPLMNAFGAIFNWLWNTIINPIVQWIMDRWNALGSLLRWVYDTIIQPAFDALSAGLDWVRSGFQTAVDNIIRIWNNLRGGLAAPVNFIIGTIWNKGIMPTWNWIAEKLGLPLATPMAEIPAYATGGSVRGKGTGTSDDIPAMLSNGEHVWTAKEVRDVGGHSQVERLRRMAASGALRFYAEGGPVTPQQMFSVVSGVLPGTRLTDGYSPRPGYHGQNRAADLAGPRSGDAPFMRRIDEFIGQKFPGSSELIHTPGPYNIKNGRPHTYNAATRADHFDHVHWANNGSAPGEGGEGGIITSFWDSIAKPALDAIINPILSNIPFRAPPQFMDVPRKGGEKMRDDIYGFARQKFVAFDSFAGGIAESVSALAAQAQVRAAAATFGWAFGPQWDAIMKLVQGESGWDTTAANPTSSARGLFQKMTSLHGPVEPTAFGQGLWGLNYIKGAYGTPVNAFAKWSSRQPHWYDNGGYLPTGLSMVMNGTGSPEPVFTGAQWAQLDPTNWVDQMAPLAASLTPSRDGRPDPETQALAAQIDRLATTLDERPPPISANSADTEAAVLRALDRRDRRRRLTEKNTYASNH